MAEMSPTVLFPVLLGWMAGLFINYVSDVLPATRQFSRPPCPQCGNHYSWTDYLTLRACRACGRKRSLRTWLVQIFSVVAFVYFWLFPSKALGIPLGMLVLIYFAIITVIDLEHRLILHPTSLFGALLGLLVGTLIHSRADGLLVGCSALESCSSCISSAHWWLAYAHGNCRQPDRLMMKKRPWAAVMCI
jgi:prepilin signal peptidase PulO-like enzyme (type II secretory pathway)